MAKNGLFHRLLVALGVREPPSPALTPNDDFAEPNQPQAIAHHPTGPLGLGEPPPPAPAFLMKLDLPEPKQPQTPKINAKRTTPLDSYGEAYEKEFPYPKPDKTPVSRLSRGGATVSGGLPSLGKRR